MGENRETAGAPVESRKRGREDSCSRDLERVAEIVMVLSAMGQMRAGMDPTAAENLLMVEAREKLAKFCESVDLPRRKNLFTKEMAMALVVDHGLNPPKDNVPRPPKLSISEKVAMTKKKMEQSQVQSSQLLSANYGLLKSENHTAVFQGAQRIFPDKPTSLPHVSLQAPVLGVPAPALSSSHSSLKQTQQNEIRRGLSPMKLPNTPAVSHLSEKTSGPSPSHSVQINREQASQMPVAYTLAGFHEPLIFDSHADICKMVQSLLPPITFDQPNWNPPSTDYINKPLNCQICKAIIKEVDALLVCDACEKGVHMKCLLSFNQRIVPKAEWHCPQCLISSSGKPLPPKYGRVTRSVSASKSSSGGVQGLERKGNSESKVNAQQSFSQVSTVGSSFIEPTAETKVTSESIVGKNDDETPEASTGNNFEAPSKQQYMSGGLLPCQMHHKTSELESSMDVGPSFVETNDSSVDEIKDSYEPMRIPDCGDHGDGKEESFSSRISDDLLATKGEKDWSRHSSSGMLIAEWVGDPVEVVEERSYYHSCSVNGGVYKIQDYLLISHTEGKLLPSKLQALWEDTRSSTKWATVTCCYYPSGLPENIQKPEPPENDEVYDSNVSKTITVASFQGICHVRPHRSPADDSTMGSISPNFLCRWFYDASNGHFRSLLSN